MSKKNSEVVPDHDQPPHDAASTGELGEEAAQQKRWANAQEKTLPATLRRPSVEKPSGGRGGRG